MDKTQLKNNPALAGKQLEVLIASIVEVTKQRERIALEDCFSRLICRLTDAKTLTIFHLQEKEEGVFVVPVMHVAQGVQISPRSANIQPFLLSTNAKIAQCLSQPYVALNPEATEKIQHELILPLQGAKGNISAYCRLENARNDENTQQVLPLLLAFYMNFLSLLDDNERDMLTGLLNRKTFDMRIAKILAALQENPPRGTVASTSEPIQFCLAALDIDHFKNVNDTFGHIYGDEVLLLFSNIMKKTFRENDLLFRFGGEEFVVLLADTGIVHAQIAAERFRNAVEKFSFPQVGKVTVSIGVALISPQEMPRTTIDRADQALYYAKQNGRNQVRIYEELLEQGLVKAQNIQTGDIELF